MTKHFLIIFLILSLLIYQSSESSAVVDPFTISIAASALLHTVVVGGAVAYKYFKRENGGAYPTSSHKVNTTTGTIGREASVTWVDLSSDGHINENTKNVSAKVKYTDLKSLVSASRYPNIYNSIYKPVNDASKHDVRPLQGSTVNISGTQYTLTNSGVITESNNKTSPPALTIPDNNIYNGVYNHYVVYNYGYQRYQYTFNSSGPSPKQQVTSSEFASNIKSASDNTVRSEFRGEIDDFIQSNPNIVHFADTEDAGAVEGSPDFVGPPTPSVTELANASAIQSAKEGLRNAWLNYSSNKGDADAKQKYLDRKFIYDKTKSDADKESAKGETEKYNPAVTSSNPYGDPEQLGDFGARTTAFLDALQSSPIFSFAQNALGNIPGGGDSLYTFSAGRYGQQSFNLSVLSGIFATLKAVILICFGVVCVKIITLKGGSG